MNKTFEDNYKKMQDLLVELDKNQDNLDESLKIYSQAKKLYKELEEQISDYRAKIEIIKKDE